MKEPKRFKSPAHLFGPLLEQSPWWCFKLSTFWVIRPNFRLFGNTALIQRQPCAGRVVLCLCLRGLIWRTFIFLDNGFQFWNHSRTILHSYFTSSPNIQAALQFLVSPSTPITAGDLWQRVIEERRLSVVDNTAAQNKIPQPLSPPVMEIN